MAENNIYAVKDLALNTFVHFFTAPNHALCLRMLSDMKRKMTESPMFLHPEQFDVYFIATWNDMSGLFTNEANVLLSSIKDIQ